MVDTHAHLSVCKPATAELIASAREAGVERILEIGMGEDSNREAIATAESDEAVFAAVGRHPNAATGFGDAAAQDLSRLAAAPVVRAIGETGLDYYRDSAPRSEQRVAFAAQIEVAAARALPLVIHMRDAEGSTEAVDEVFETLDARAEGVAVILHCFSAPHRVDDAVERGWYCSFAGNVTYPRSNELRAAAAAVPEGLLLVETDSPFLSPQARRGKPNQPANVGETARVVAEARGASLEEVERDVEQNARRIFGW